MAYVRKTRDVWTVLAYTGHQFRGRSDSQSGYGWEEMTAELTYREARDRLREYRENQPQYRYKLRLKRERIQTTA